MTFKELPIGAMFKFASKYTPYRGVKISPRRYRTTANNNGKEYIAQVGSINVEVIHEPNSPS